MSSQFDSYKDSYKHNVESSISFIHQGLDFFITSKVEWLENIINLYYKNSTISLLDFGCGTGYAHTFFKNKNIKIFGTDIAAELILKAKINNPGNLYEVYNGTTLPYKTESFDVIVAMCVFHHIPKNKQKETLLKLKSLLKKDGIFIVFEHNPYNPLTQLAVFRCEFDKDAVLISSKNMMNLFHQTLFKNILRRYILYFPFNFFFREKVEYFFQWLALGAQYYIIGKK